MLKGDFLKKGKVKVKLNRASKGLNQEKENKFHDKKKNQ